MAENIFSKTDSRSVKHPLFIPQGPYPYLSGPIFDLGNATYIFLLKCILSCIHRAPSGAIKMIRGVFFDVFYGYKQKSKKNFFFAFFTPEPGFFKIEPLKVK